MARTWIFLANDAMPFDPDHPMHPPVSPRVTATPRLVPLASAGALAAVAVLATVPSALAAQEHDPSMHQPYAGLEDRVIKALSADEVEGLRSGAGLQMALAAELNGWPGPKHVLELADSLALTPDQRAGVEEVRERMSREAVELGAALLEVESELDRRFAHGHVSADDVAALTARAAELRGRLRAVHLVAHLHTRELLEPAQVEAYARLRGYR